MPNSNAEGRRENGQEFHGFFPDLLKGSLNARQQNLKKQPFWLRG
ncbi:hypothetical protein [Moorena sp. SIO4A5]|nr:hypothetical protein [Moorena sp. SIO4A5]